MGDLLDEFSDKYAHEAKLERVQITKVQAEEQPTTRRFLDRIEDEFFSFMADEMRKLKGAK